MSFEAFQLKFKKKIKDQECFGFNIIVFQCHFSSLVYRAGGNMVIVI